MWWTNNEAIHSGNDQTTLTGGKIAKDFALANRTESHGRALLWSRARRVKGDDSAEKNYVMQRSATSLVMRFPWNTGTRPWWRLQFCRGPVIFETHPNQDIEGCESDDESLFVTFGKRIRYLRKNNGDRVDARHREMFCPLKSKQILRLSSFPVFPKRWPSCPLGHFIWRSSHRSQLS